MFLVFLATMACLSIVHACVGFIFDFFFFFQQKAANRMHIKGVSSGLFPSHPGAVGTLAGVGREAEGALRERFREFMGGFDFVSRDEFDAVKAMAAAARDEVEELKARLEALEKKSAKAGKAAADKSAGLDI